MKNSTIKQIVINIFYVFIFALLLQNSFNYLDSDFGWHIKVGEEIIQNKNVPHLNHYNFSLTDVNWVDHEWLTNALMYLVYNYYGHIMLTIIFALLVLFSIVLLNRYVIHNYLNNKPRLLLIMFFTYLGVEAMSPHLGVRVQEISISFLLLLYIIIFYYNKNKNYKILFLLPPLFAIWANLHGGFLLGMALMFFWVSIKTAEVFIIRKNLHKNIFFRFLNFEQQLKPKEIRNFFIAAIIASLATLLTPYGFELYSFLFSYKDTFYLNHIAEWLPFYTHPVIYKQLLYMGIVIAALLISYGYTLKTKNKKFQINCWEFATIMVLLFFSLKSKRHFPLFFITSYPFLISFFNIFFPRLKDTHVLSRHKRIASLFITINLSLFAFYFIANINWVNQPFGHYNNKYPQEALTYLKDNPQYDNYRLFNYYSWGGYLIWEYPERKIFIDGRLPQFQFGEHSILEEYYKFFEDEKSEEMLTKNNISLILLKRNYPEKFNFFEKFFLGMNENNVNKEENHLQNFLDNSVDWELIHSTEISYLYAKTKN